jgi:hypothetical protein
MFALQVCLFQSAACANEHQEKNTSLHSKVQSLSTCHFMLAAYEFHASGYPVGAGNTHKKNICFFNGIKST